jgi:hypothetical protein
MDIDFYRAHSSAPVKHNAGSASSPSLEVGESLFFLATSIPPCHPIARSNRGDDTRHPIDIFIVFKLPVPYQHDAENKNLAKMQNIYCTEIT